MTFIRKIQEKIINPVRGAINPDYKYDDEMKAQIKKSSKAEYYKAKEEQSLIFAREKAKFETESKLKRLKAPPRRFVSPFTGGTAVQMFGGNIKPKAISGNSTKKKVVSYKPVMRNGHKTYKRIVRYKKVGTQLPQQPKKIDIIGGGW